MGALAFIKYIAFSSTSAPRIFLYKSFVSAAVPPETPKAGSSSPVSLSIYTFVIKSTRPTPKPLASITIYLALYL